MKTVNFTEFRKRASELFSEVEQGEKIIVTRHGKAIAEIMSPDQETAGVPSWKIPVERVAIRGGGLAQTIIEERESCR